VAELPRHALFQNVLVAGDNQLPVLIEAGRQAHPASTSLPLDQLLAQYSYLLA